MFVLASDSDAKELFVRRLPSTRVLLFPGSHNHNSMEIK